jgi:hypothetical protein
MTELCLLNCSHIDGKRTEAYDIRIQRKLEPSPVEKIPDRPRGHELRVVDLGDVRRPLPLQHVLYSGSDLG